VPRKETDQGRGIRKSACKTKMTEKRTRRGARWAVAFIPRFRAKRKRASRRFFIGESGDDRACKKEEGEGEKGSGKKGILRHTEHPTAEKESHSNKAYATQGGGRSAANSAGGKKRGGEPGLDLCRRLKGNYSLLYRGERET